MRLSGSDTPCNSAACPTTTCPNAVTARRNLRIMMTASRLIVAFRTAMYPVNRRRTIGYRIHTRDDWSRHRIFWSGKRISCQNTTGAIILTVLLVIPGCRSSPDFVSHVQKECVGGDQLACDLLDAFSHPNSAIGAPMPGDISGDVDAILKGIDRARSAPRVGYQHMPPIAL